MKFNAGIMAFDFTKDLTHFIIGMNDGTFEIRERKKAVEDEEAKDELPLPKFDGADNRIVRNYRFFYRGVFE